MTLATRPTGAVPIPASDSLISSGEFAGQPTKTRPLDAQIAQGELPLEPRWSNLANWLANDLAKRVAMSDLAGYTNWPEPGQNLGVLAMSGTPNAAGNLAWLPSYEIERIFAVQVNGDHVMESRDGGYTWANSFAAISGADFKRIANRDASVMALYDDSGTFKITRLDGGTNVWTSATLTAAFNQITTIVADPYEAAYYVLGRRNSINDAGITKLTDSGTPVQTALDPASDGNNVPMLVAACSPTHVLAFKDELSPFRWGRVGTTVSVLADVPVSGSPRSLTWDPEAGRFVLILRDVGGSTTRVLVSTDGSTWTVRSATPIANVDVTLRSSVQVGGVLVVSGEWTPGTQRVLAVSSDAGVTWALMPDPMARHTTGIGGKTETLSQIGNRIAATGYVGAGQQLAVYSARGGPLR